MYHINERFRSQTSKVNHTTMVCHFSVVTEADKSMEPNCCKHTSDNEKGHKIISLSRPKALQIKQEEIANDQHEKNS